MKRNIIAAGLIIVVILSILFVVGESSVTSSARLVNQSSMVAAVGDTNATPVIGWAWTPNTGWISFNSANVEDTGNVGYGVTVSTSSVSTRGDLRGYAWSSNVGWISFDPEHVQGCPADASETAINGCSPTIEMNTGRVTGWARILSSTSTDNGGGWLHLSGTKHATVPGLTGTATSTLGVSYNKETGELSGFAFEPAASGWVRFTSNPSIGVAGVEIKVTPDSEELTATCKTNGDFINVVVGPDGEATLSVEGVSGGVEPYDYRWSNGISWSGYGSDTSYLATYYGSPSETIPYTPLVTVRDATSKTFITRCPTVTQLGTYEDYGMKLMILPENLNEADAPSETDYNDNPVGPYKSLAVRKGESFKLQFNAKIIFNETSRYFRVVMSPQDYCGVDGLSETCVKNKVKKLTENVGAGSDYSITVGADSSVLDIGAYKFTVQYTTDIFNSNSWQNGSSVTLEVADSIFLEI